MRPFPIFAFLFLIVPLVEIYFLVKVGESIGAWRTILLVVFTAVVGVFLLRQQGLATFGRFQKNMMEGKAPAGEMLEGVFLLFGGLLLLVPGFFTDAIGFFCLIPFTRQLMAGWMLKNSAVQMNSTMGGFHTGHGRADEHIIDGEFVHKSDDRLDRM